jgi:hypothetical protein
VKPFTLNDVRGLPVDIIPVLDDPGGDRIIISIPVGQTARLDKSGAASLRNQLSNWLGETRRKEK